MNKRIRSTDLKSSLLAKKFNAEQVNQITKLIGANCISWRDTREALSKAGYSKTEIDYIISTR